MSAIIEGYNGTFVGNQDDIFKARDTIAQAIKSIDNGSKIDKNDAEEYLRSFELIDVIYGLNENQIKYRDILTKWKVTKKSAMI